LDSDSIRSNECLGGQVREPWKLVLEPSPHCVYSSAILHSSFVGLVGVGKEGVVNVVAEHELVRER
jgi:hypothetical protein